jgi:ribosomal protein L11 methyltransferase
MWIVKASVPPETASFWADVLEPHCLAVSFYETDEEADWLLEALCGDQKPHLPTLQGFLEETACAKRPAPQLVLENLPERNWLEENKLSFPPLTIGDFYLYGSHHQGPLPEDKMCLLIDAATAFGSGHHGTTSGCLALLQDQLKAHPWADALDLGCGSGVLALAMVSLNPNAPVLAVDNDLESVVVTQRNLTLNHKDAHMKVLLSEGFAAVPPGASFDLITANILAQPLIDLAPTMARFVRSGGCVILSGFLDTQWPDVQAVYLKYGFEPVRHLITDHWVALCVQKKSV